VIGRENLVDELQVSPPWKIKKRKGIQNAHKQENLKKE